MFKILNATTQSITQVSSEIDPSLVEETKLKGLLPPNYYVVDLKLDNADGSLKPGMRGQARTYGRRRSLAAFFWEGISHFFARKLW
jgi:hypothetical protein